MTAIPLTAASVAAAAGGTVVAGDPRQPFDGVSIDTRTVRRGELFIAIRGERFDGAEFAAAAIDAGADGVLVPRGWLENASLSGERTSSASGSASLSGERTSGASGSASLSGERTSRASGSASLSGERTSSASGSASLSGERKSVAVIEVADTTIALQSLGRAIRRESGARVVAITGSAGKTTTKEVTSELLSARYRVTRNRGNFNNHIGLPLSLIELRQQPEIAVVELGMNHAGEISTLVRIAEPEVRVWTNVGEAHLGFFASLEAIADAKAEILEAARPTDLLITNADDARITTRTGAFAGRVITFGIDRDADVRASSIVDRGIEGVSARVTTPRGSAEVTTPLVGRGNLANVLAAIAVALEFDVPLPDIAARVSTLHPASHRGEIVRLANGVTVIDDSYNANPTATRRAIEVLAGSRATRRFAVIGEMLELGAHADDLHAEVGRAAADAALDGLIAVGGPAARVLADAAVRAGMAAASVRYCATSEEAASAAAAALRAGDLLLVKGSRGIKTDRVVDRLKSEWGG